MELQIGSACEGGVALTLPTAQGRLPVKRPVRLQLEAFARGRVGFAGVGPERVGGVLDGGAAGVDLFDQGVALDAVFGSSRALSESSPALSKRPTAMSGSLRRVVSGFSQKIEPPSECAVLAIGCADFPYRPFASFTRHPSTQS